jgi:Domain of unknown function (DUF397)
MDLSRAKWRKATYSGNGGASCVEVASNLPGLIAVRDSKDRGGPALLFTPTEWVAFTAALKTSHLDLP